MITLIIVGITVLVSIFAMSNETLKNKLMFNAYMINHRKEWYRFFSNGLIHADWVHLLFNMYALWMFGKGVEMMYAQVYDIGGLVMSSLYSYEKNKNNIYYNSLGASGAVSAVIFAFIVLSPTTQLGFMFIPVPIPAYLFGLIILGIEHYLSRRGSTGIAHDAHFWGSIFGIAFTIALKPGLAIDFIDKIQGNY
jgi:membrane associated rhomboid family serine protease